MDASALVANGDYESVADLILAASRALAIQQSSQDLIAYAQYMTPDPNHPDDVEKSLYSVEVHHRFLGEALQKVERGEIMKLAISIPPQHGKSQLCSRLFPSWFAGRNPWKHLILGTYNQEFAQEFGGDVRTYLESPRFADVFPDSQLKQGSKAKDHMVMNGGGKLNFIGRDGSGTGRPADGLIIDDPIKNAKEAESLTIRNDVWNFFTRVANTRCHSLSFQIIIQTRWHEDDLIGRLTDPTNAHYDPEVAKQWTYINIPAILDDEALATAMGKKVGDALWPKRFPLTLLDTAKRLDPIGFSALYMGRPTPPEGSFYKSDMLIGYERRELPKNYMAYGTFDLAVSPERDADSSVILNWALDEDDVLWLLPDIYWEKQPADVSVENILQFAKQYSWFDAWGEKGQIDRMLRPFLNKRMQEEELFFNYHAMPVSGNKGMRSVAMRGRMAQGKVRFPKFASWWPRAQEQILKFTGSGNDKEDDFCDAMALIGAALQSQVKATAVKKVGNVLKVGSLAWIKKQSKIESEQAQRRKFAKGF